MEKQNIKTLKSKIKNIKKEIEISKIKFACFKGKVKLKLRGKKIDMISNIPRDIYDLSIYDTEITDTQTISQEEYDSYQSVEGKLTPELIESLIERPGSGTEKRFYVEDVRNCIIFNYTFESFKKESNSFAIVRGEIVFQIEFRIMEKTIIHVPEKKYIIIPANKIKIKRAAVEYTPRESGEYLKHHYILDLIAGIFQVFAIAAILLTLIFALRNVWQIALIVIGVLGLMWFIGYFGKYLLKIVGTLLSWVTFMLILGLLITWFSEGRTDTEQSSNKEEYEDITENDSILYIEKESPTENDSIQSDSLSTDSINIEYINNSLNWSDYSFHNYSIDYQIDTRNFKQARKNRSEYEGFNWPAIYNNLYQNDKNLLKNIFQKYDSLQTGQNALDFARIIVSSIQQVPYTWILPESCFNSPNQQEIDNSGYGCLGNVKHYGVQSPLEFMANQKGDCDTKALVIYSILKHFNYDVCILTSVIYEHALLGINIPANGKYKSHQGKKYYVWETTVKGLDIGQLPPTHSNMAFWEVSL